MNPHISSNGAPEPKLAAEFLEAVYYQQVPWPIHICAENVPTSPCR